MSDPLDQFRAAIQAALGFAPSRLRPDVFERFPTSERRGDSSGYAKIFGDYRGGVFGCYRQGFSGKWFAADQRTLSAAERTAMQRHIKAATRQRFAAQREAWTENAARIASLWSICGPVVDGDPVARYLANRGLGGVRPTCIRSHPALDYWHAGQKLGTFPAMVASVTEAQGRLIALHRTYLDAQGHKADVPAVRKMTGASAVLGGASIKLFSATPTIGIAEGIETAIAAFLGSGVPTMAAYCANNLSTYRWPIGTDSLIVFADNDPAGRQASETLQARAKQGGLHVKVMKPTRPGDDWCDVWTKRAEVSA